MQRARTWVLLVILTACTRKRSDVRRLVDEEAHDVAKPTCAQPCGEDCPDLRHDVRHCGACDVACDEGSRCIAGACTVEAVFNTVVRQPICTPGRRLAFHCAASPLPSSASSLWGTDRYTDDSFVCLAAVHAGLIEPSSGGDVAIEIRRGLSAYAGSTRHALTSQSWPAWPCSFVFVGDRCAPETVRCDDACTDVSVDEWNCGACGHRCGEDEGCVRGKCEIAPVDWATNAAAYPCDPGAKHSLTCPASGTLGRTIWGTDVYTSDSAICVAGVHAGKITLAAGGRVTIEILAGASSYAGSTRYGVTSNGYGAWGCSYQFD